MENFLVASEDCLIVREFREGNSLRELATRLGYDPSALARKVQRISERHHLLEKIKGRWVLTDRGRALNQWTEDSLRSQRQVFAQGLPIKLATTMWMSERLVIPNIIELKKRVTPEQQWSVVTAQVNLEADLLAGLCDFVLACHAPIDPLVRFKKIAPEEWVIAIPTAWKSVFSKIEFSKVLPLIKTYPFLRHRELNPQSWLDHSGENLHVALTLDHLIGVRAALLAGLGWSIVPRWLIQEELAARKIFSITLPALPTQQYLCLWWLRGRHEIHLLSPTVCDWLKSICST